MVIAAAAGSVTASGTLLPYLSGSSLRNTGSFILNANPSSLSIAQGAFSLSTITVTSLNGFSGEVALSTTFTGSSLPATLSTNPLTVSAGGKATSTLNVTVPIIAATGEYGVVVTGTAVLSKRIPSSSTSISVEVGSLADFSLFAQPYSLVEVAGSTDSTTVILNSLNGFNGTVSLSVTAPFGFIGVMGGVNPITLSSGGTNSTTLKISTTTAMVPGTYNITVTGTSGQHSHYCTVVVYVYDPQVESLALTGYVFTSPTTLDLYLKNNGTTPVTLNSYSVKDFAGDAWTLVNWAGPVIAPGTTVTVEVAIGASCPACTYTWVIGFFPEFIQGQAYTVQFTTMATNQFSFNVKY